MFSLLQAAASGGGAPQNVSGAPQQPSMWPTIAMMVAIFAIVYFFMIRPQSKKQKEIQKFRNSLKEGQDVVTIGGVHGVIKSINEKENTVVLEVATGTKVTFDKSAIVPAGTAPVQR